MMNPTDTEYALLVVRDLVRMVKYTAYYQQFVRPRDITRSNADREEVVAALEYAASLLTAQISGDRIGKALRKDSWADE